MWTESVLTGLLKLIFLKSSFGSLVWMVAVIYCSKRGGDTMMADSDGCEGGTLCIGPACCAEPDGGSRAGIVWLYCCTSGGSGDASANFIYVTDNHPNKAGHVIPSTWTDDWVFFYSFRAINISTFSISLQFQKQSTINIYLCTQLKSSIHSF